MKTFTPEQLTEILRKHSLWLKGEEGGEKADLSGSDLSGSNLSGSNLSGSNLRGSIGLVYIGQRTDGYQFYAVYNENDKQWYIRAGCRYKTIAEYREHALTYECDIKRQETLDLLDFAEKRINLLGRIPS